MILIYMLACRSVGGSEGFVIADAVLLHLAHSQVTEFQGDYSEYYKEHSGSNVLFAWGGGKCSDKWYAQASPEDEGWEANPDAANTPEEQCARYAEAGIQYDAYHPGYVKQLSLRIDDYPYEDVISSVSLLECDNNGETEVDVGALTSAAVELHGDKGHITAKAGSKLVVDLTLPLCLVDY